MRESYLAADFRRTVRKRFPGQAEGLNAAFDVRLRTLWAESAGESRAKRRHLKSQILPGIAAYETLRTVLPQEEALRTVHGYLEAYAGRAHRLIVMLPRGNLMYQQGLNRMWSRNHRHAAARESHVLAAV